MFKFSRTILIESAPGSLGELCVKLRNGRFRDVAVVASVADAEPLLSHSRQKTSDLVIFIEAADGNDLNTFLSKTMGDPELSHTQTVAVVNAVDFSVLVKLYQLGLASHVELACTDAQLDRALGRLFARGKKSA